MRYLDDGDRDGDIVAAAALAIRAGCRGVDGNFVKLTTT